MPVAVATCVRLGGTVMGLVPAASLPGDPWSQLAVELTWYHRVTEWDGREEWWC